MSLLLNKQGFGKKRKLRTKVAYASQEEEVNIISPLYTHTALAVSRLFHHHRHQWDVCVCVFHLSISVVLCRFFHSPSVVVVVCSRYDACCPRAAGRNGFHFFISLTCFPFHPVTLSHISSQDRIQDVSDTMLALFLGVSYYVVGIVAYSYNVERFSVGDSIYFATVSNKSTDDEGRERGCLHSHYSHHHHPPTPTHQPTITTHTHHLSLHAPHHLSPCPPRNLHFSPLLTTHPPPTHSPTQSGDHDDGRVR
jgi:hypothetical protein